MALSTAERQARHRDRSRGRDDLILAALEAQAAALEALRHAVDNLAKTVDKSQKSLRNGANRDVTAEGAHVRARETAPLPLKGERGRTDDDSHRVLVALVRPASVGAIHDALSAVGADLTLARVSAALVALQGSGQVHRIPGEGRDPDRWAAVEDAHLEDLAGPSPLRLADSGPDLHVTCQDYQGHQASHRWDGARFVCDRCPPLHGPLAVPPRRGAASPQEVVHAAPP